MHIPRPGTGALRNRNRRIAVTGSMKLSLCCLDLDLGFSTHDDAN